MTHEELIEIQVINIVQCLQEITKVLAKYNGIIQSYRENYLIQQAKQYK